MTHKCSCSDKKPGLPKGDVFQLTRLIQYSEGSVVSRTLHEAPGGTVTLFAFDAGQGLSEHSAPYDALVQVLDGAVDIAIGGEPRHVKTGEAVIMPANVPHALRSDTRFKMLLTMIRQ